MYYVGIDVSKKFHIVCVLDEDNNLLKKNFKVESEIEQFDALYQMLHLIDSDVSQFLIGD